MAALQERGIREFHFWDDIFNCRASWMLEVLREIGRTCGPVAMAFPNGLRGDRLDDELLRKMAKSGVYFSAIALESGSARIQNLIRKRLDLRKVLGSIRAARRQRIVMQGYFMLGFPGETEDEARQTIRVACESDLPLARFFFVTPFPGTEIHRAFVGPAKQHPLFDYSVPFPDLAAISVERLMQLRDEAMQEFYGNPKRLEILAEARPAFLERNRKVLSDYAESRLLCRPPSQTKPSAILGQAERPEGLR